MNWRLWKYLTGATYNPFEDDHPARQGAGLLMLPGTIEPECTMWEVLKDGTRVTYNPNNPDKYKDKRVDTPLEKTKIGKILIEEYKEDLKSDDKDTTMKVETILKKLSISGADKDKFMPHVEVASALEASNEHL